MKKIKELAEKYSSEELEKCIDQHLREGQNVCFFGTDDTETMNKLSKASYIKQLVEKGESENVTDAIRKLASSMRGMTGPGS